MGVDKLCPVSRSGARKGPRCPDLPFLFVQRFSEMTSCVYLTRTSLPPQGPSPTRGLCQTAWGGQSGQEGVRGRAGWPAHQIRAWSPLAWRRRGCSLLTRPHPVLQARNQGIAEFPSSAGACLLAAAPSLCLLVSPAALSLPLTVPGLLPHCSLGRSPPRAVVSLL